MTTEYINAKLYTKDLSFLYSRGHHWWYQKQLGNVSSTMTFGLLFCLNFHHFDYCVSWCVTPWVYPSWDSLCFLDVVEYFHSHVREVFSYYLFRYLLRSSLFSPFGTPIMWTLVYLVLFQISLKLSSLLYILVFFCLVAVISTSLSSSSVICFPTSFSPLLTTSVYFSFQLLYSSILFSCLLYFLTRC